MSKNIENINLENICRTCLNDCDVKFIRDHVISNVFYKLTNIHFETIKDLPQQICLKCFEKINEIHEFSFQCKRSHSTLMKCLNNVEESQLNEDQDVIQSSDEEEFLEPIVKLGENLTFDINLQLNINVNNELQETEVIPVDSNYSDEKILPHKRKVNNDQIINCSEYETYEQSNSNSVVNVLTGDINLSNNTISSDKDVIETYENKSSKSNEKQSAKPFTKSSNPNDGRVHRNEQRYKCEYCSKSFKQSNYLRVHKRTHTGERLYACKQCSKSFTCSNNLLKHMRIHSGERPYRCKDCSKSFAQADYLKMHAIMHSDKRPYKCNQCPKSFNRTKSLNNHMRTHSDERPFKCGVCSTSFKFWSNLWEHKYTHSGERPHKCNQCPKAFISSSNLKVHMRNHSGERPFKCEVCSKSFTQSGNLKHHMDTHSDERYKCTSCDKSFYHLTSVRRHILKKHFRYI